MRHRITATWLLARKDLFHLRAYAILAWSALLAGILAELAVKAGWGALGVVRSSGLALGLALLAGLLGSIAAVTLDCPWNPRSFALGRPITGGSIFAAKLPALALALLVPGMLMPLPGGGFAAESAMDVAGLFMLFLISAHLSIHFRRPALALLAHFVLLYAFIHAARNRWMPLPRYSDAPPLAAGDAFLALALMGIASIRSRWLARFATVLALGAFGLALFEVRKP